MSSDLADVALRGGGSLRGIYRHRIPDVVAIILWIVIGVLAMVAVLRVMAWDAFSPLAILNALTMIIYLPAWLIAIAGALGRRPILAGVALLVGIAQLVLIAPELTASQPLPNWAARAPTFTLLDANVFFGNPSMSGYVQQIRAVRPHVITFEECTPNDVAQLRSSGALAALPYQFEVFGTDPFIFFIASRYPLSDTRVERLGEHPFAVETVIALPSGPQALWVVHTIAPLPVSFGQWTGQLAQIDRLVRDRGIHGLLMVGDFNATWNNKGFRQILTTGLVDAAAARGQALTMTWSQTMSPLPPLVRMDHVLTCPGVAVTRIATEHGPGSDHRDLVATVATR
jgi:endonuclease/exonuclease/phosphatase (EEP) superfamily protein YafD